jgi:hypothetical protein
MFSTQNLKPRLFKGSDYPNLINEKNDELVYFASRGGCPNSLKKLLKFGSNPNARFSKKE